MNIFKLILTTLLFALASTAGTIDELTEEICDELFAIQKETIDTNYEKSRLVLQEAKFNGEHAHESQQQNLKDTVDRAQTAFDEQCRIQEESATIDRNLQRQFVKQILVNECTYDDLVVFRAYERCIVQEKYLVDLIATIKNTFPLERLLGHEPTNDVEKTKKLFDYPALNQFRQDMIATCQQSYGITMPYTMSLDCEIGLAY